MKTRRYVTSVLVTAVCDQPETFASDLGDDQSRYLFEYNSGKSEAIGAKFYNYRRRARGTLHCKLLVQSAKNARYPMVN